MSSRTMYVYTQSGKGLNLRSAPSTSSKVITSFKVGTALLVETDIKELLNHPGWVKVLHPASGYCSLQYLKPTKIITSTNSSTSSNKSNTYTLKNVHHGDIINMQNQSWYDCWIDNFVTEEHIILPQTPVGWGENYSANYANQEIIGSSRPRLMYTGTSLRTMTFSLQNLTRDYLPSGFESLVEYVHKLQSLCFPEYSSTGVVTAPDCHLQIGDRGFRGIFTSVSVSWGDEVYNSGDNYKILGNSGNTRGINKNATGAYSGTDKKKWKIKGGERIRCNVELAFTNTRLGDEIPGATTISLKG